jgi:hypothetical protein
MIVSMNAKVVVVPFGLPRSVAEELIHRLAKANEFGMASDFMSKMLVRKFDMRQVLETIKEGVVNQVPARDEYGEWKCRIKRRVAGRTVRVVVAISSAQTFLTLISIH